MKKIYFLVFTIFFFFFLSFGDDLITFSAKNAPIDVILKNIAAEKNLNFVIGSGVVSKKITISLKNVSLDVALNLISKAGGFSYEKMGNTILIDTAEHIDTKINSKLSVFHLNYIKAKDFAESLSGFENIVVTVNESTNSIFVAATPDKLIRIQKIIKRLDKVPSQILISAELIEVSTDKLKAAGINWSALSSQLFIFSEGQNGVAASDLEALPDQAGYVKPLGGSTTLYRQFKSFKVPLDMILNKGYGKMLSDTKLVAMNNKEASIHVGDLVPYEVTTVSNGQTSVSVEKEEVGIKLKITPQVSSDGNITIHVVPEVSNIYGWKGRNNDIPWIKRRTADTTVTVKSGEPIYIAGLKSENTTIEHKGVFLLSDIPVLGKLFRYKKKTVTNTDLIIKITPIIVSGSNEKIFKKFNAIEKKG